MASRTRCNTSGRRWAVITYVTVYVSGSKMSSDSVFFQAEDGIRDYKVTGVQTCALPIFDSHVLRELPFERVDLLRPVADAVVAEEVLAANHPLEGLELLVADLHPAGEHRAQIGRASCRERV